MTIHTEHKVTLTEGQISAILDSLEYTLNHRAGHNTRFKEVYKELEGTIDKYYEKVEKAQAKQPTPQWD